MSDGLRDAIREFCIASDKADKDAEQLGYIDFSDISFNDEPTETNGIPVKSFDDWVKEWNAKYKCDCGGEKANTTHAHWCSTRKS